MKIFYRRAPTRHDFHHLMIRSFEACVLAAERAGGSLFRRLLLKQADISP
jgi:hypothetical protein